MSAPEHAPATSPDYPHRLCPVLHEFVPLAALPAVALAIAYGGLGMGALLGFLGVIQVALVKLSASTASADNPRPLAVRPRWAAVAAVSDVLVLLALLGFIACVWCDRSFAAVPAPTAAGFGAVLSVSLLAALHHFAHELAAGPVDSPDSAEDADATSETASDGAAPLR